MFTGKVSRGTQWTGVASFAMGILSWFLDQVFLTLNVIAFFVPIAIAANGYQMLVPALSAWAGRAPWLPRLAGILQVIIVLSLFLAIYWVGFRLLGFPSWMRWIAG